MSSQRALTDYSESEPTPGQDTQAATNWQPRGDPRCVCGATVDPEAVRVYGVEGVVPACPNCWTTRESERDRRFTTVSACVVAFQDSRTVNSRKPGVDVDASAHPEVSEDA
jgi:hypothetical protein